MIIDRESQLFNLEIEINNQKKFRYFTASDRKMVEK